MWLPHVWRNYVVHFVEIEEGYFLIPYICVVLANEIENNFTSHFLIFARHLLKWDRT